MSRYKQRSQTETGRRSYSVVLVRTWTDGRDGSIANNLGKSGLLPSPPVHGQETQDHGDNDASYMGRVG